MGKILFCLDTENIYGTYCDIPFLFIYIKNYFVFISLHMKLKFEVKFVSRWKMSKVNNTLYKGPFKLHKRYIFICIN